MSEVEKTSWVEQISGDEKMSEVNAYPISLTKLFLAGQNQILASQKHQNPIQK